MKYHPFGATGIGLSALGFGASPFGDLYHSTNEAGRTAAVATAVDSGINVFDVSPFYGITLAEERLGNALAGRRQQVFLSTKCGRYDFQVFDFSAARVQSSVEESLRRLQTDYVDLLLAHDIEFGDQKQILHETLPAMKKQQEQGKVRFVGVSSYQLGLLAECIKTCEIDAVLSYCRYNLFVDDMDAVLTPVAAAHGVAVINASPLHMGLLTTVGPPTWHPATPEVKLAAGRVMEFCREHSLDAAAVALRFCLDHPYVCSTLTGMSDAEQVRHNLKAADMSISADALAEIKAILAPIKNSIWQSGRPEYADQHLVGRS